MNAPLDLEVFRTWYGPVHKAFAPRWRRTRARHWSAT
ncbi:hypothetical protein J2X16_002289 [Pelomonas aquatica]|uniref:Uncharacterized protein n=1 Tax=Pelomonas aquatica TaxID=431058 RepID=A0ABU1Z8K4_9BURK|nr:hypothetical protein [Pelomonas aquatica]